MEIHERVKELRKKYLKMSQTAFGKRLGFSRSVINNIELNVLARPEQKLSLLKLICKEFSVSEEWLLNGTGDMFASNEAEYSALIDQRMTGENEFAKNIFKTFALFEEDWEALQHMIKPYLAVSAAPNLLRVAVYIRVSTDAQAKKWDGILFQLHPIHIVHIPDSIPDIHKISLSFYSISRLFIIHSLIH